MGWLVNHPRYTELLAALDTDQAWRSLADIGDEYCRVLSAADLARAEHRPSPSHYLLERISALFDQPLSVEEAEALLRALDGPAAAAADLLRPPQPLSVTPLSETNSPCVWAPLGGRLLLHCQAEGWPPPSYQWHHDNRPISPSAGGDLAQLSVQPFASAAAGLYSCTVRDAAGCTVNAGSVAVQPRQTPPRQEGRQVTGGVLSDGGVVSAAGGRPLTLRVDWLGWPEPTLRWERAGEPLPEADRAEITLQPGPEMVEGSYVCVATNAVGEVPSDPFRVEVDQRPVISVHPKPAQRSHPIGRPLKLRCEAFCRRPVKVRWRRSVGDDAGRVMPPSQVYTEATQDGQVTSELTLTPTESEVRQLCSVTCEFFADGDYEHSFTQSRRAEFTVVYPACSKMALIIGNSKYDNLPSLPEVREDVSNFRDAMRELGFGTLLAMNLCTQRSKRVVRYFARIAAPGAYLVVLVAGHGFTHQRQGYLAPVDHPKLKDGFGADPGRCLSMLDDVEPLLQGTNPKLVVVCSDMCRTRNEVAAVAADPRPDHPPDRPPPETPNVVRIYSTQMGHEAMDDSKFMWRLLENIKRDITVQQLSLKMLGEVYGPSPAADQMSQHPTVELSIAADRGLRDPADSTTALDAQLVRNVQLPVQASACSMMFNMLLEVTWSNYVFDSEPELLLTLHLKGAPAGWFVCNVVAPKMWFQPESYDRSSAVSSWRVTGLPPAGGLFPFKMAVLVLSDTDKKLPYQLPEQLTLHPGLGLCDAPNTQRAPVPSPATPTESKVSNVPDCGDPL